MPAISGMLNRLELGLQVVHERRTGVRATVAHMPRNDQFGVWIHRGPRPNVASIGRG